ncbi:hypothetical protein GCM10027280_48120 [Micromonospora polyrhachis]|uniref:Uncharacterized protein n=1 Tax=Micromonospora polyrhachis TaxID=1282883 RepID=A0A7W7WR97_9ACTN|nr:hypothetical protein [Micromonospora polyrhachis]MBB4960664.1 hypothetical protein [Micromonospora polyrhachis]
MTSSGTERTARRRAVLRTAATAAGAAVAATAATVANGSPASAANGDPVKIGQPNTGGSTTLRSSAAGDLSTLEVANPNGTTLRLTSNPVSAPTPGALHMSPSGLAVAGVSPGDSVVRSQQVFSTANATMPWPIAPTRILDTRTAAGRSRLLWGADAIDSSGRAEAGAILAVHLKDIVSWGYGMLGNVTVANTARSGFATVWSGADDVPASSTINWWGAGQLLSNGVITQLAMWDADYPDFVAIAVASPAVVILDVTALLVYSPADVELGNAAAAKAAGGRAAFGSGAARKDRPVQQVTARRQR